MKKKWFSIWELLMVILIIGILSVFLLTRVKSPKNWNMVYAELRSVFNNTVYQEDSGFLYIDIPKHWCQNGDMNNCHVVDNCITKVVNCDSKERHCLGLTDQKDYDFFTVLGKLNKGEMRETIDRITEYKLCPRKLADGTLNKNKAFSSALENPSFSISFLPKDSNLIETFTWSFK